jgi:integrase
MAGKVKYKNIESRTARSRLKRGRQPHWQSLVTGKVHLGYQCWKGDKEGRWVLRRYIGNDTYRTETLGRADDLAEADGQNIRTHEQAEAKARAMVAAPEEGGKITNITVRQAMALYTKYKSDKGQPISDLKSRTAVHILPDLGNLVVAELTAERPRHWLATMAAAPAQTRSKDGKPKYKAEPVSDEDIRRRRATANRVLTMLKAALNHAFDEKHVSNRDAWGRRLEPFEDVEVARMRYLTIAEAKRLINASDAEFRPLVRAALETGCRYSEMTRLEVQDFNRDADTVAVRKSKSGKPRHVVLTEEGADFFRQHCAGRGRGELMFRHANGSPWQKSEQSRPMREASERARITPAVSFHILRHTWASLAVMNGVPLLLVARNLGHLNRDGQPHTRMVEKHYAHLAPSYITEAIRAGAPVYGIKTTKRVVPLA